MQQRISFAICAFSSENLVRLALGELGSTTGGLQTVLLALLHARITSQETSLLQIAAQFGVGLAQGAGDTVTDSASLAGEATAVYVNNNVELANGIGNAEGLVNDELHGLKTEVLVDVSAVNGNNAATGIEANSSNGLLSSTGSVEIGFSTCIHSHLPPISR